MQNLAVLPQLRGKPLVKRVFAPPESEGLKGSVFRISEVKGWVNNEKTTNSEQTLDKFRMISHWFEYSVFGGPGFDTRRGARERELKILDEVGNIHWHLINACVVKFLDVVKGAFVIVGDEVDGNTFTAETTTTSNSVNVVFSICWQIIINNQGDLLDVDTTGQQISSNKDSGRT